MTFENYKVVLTGADKPLGKATAKLFMDEGATVIGIGKSTENPDNRMISCACDIAKAENISEAVAFIYKTFGGALDTFISADAVFPFGSPDAFADEQYDEAMSVLLRAPMLFAKALYPMLLKAPQGNPAIVNVASTMAFSNEPRAFLYNVANSALVRFTKIAANQFGPVRCNTISPGLVNDDLFTRDGKLSPEQAATVQTALLAMTTIQRMSEPEEIAEAIAFIASVDSIYTTGTDLLIDGGISARMM